MVSCRTCHLLIAVVVGAGSGQMIAACGQKGALYLPQPEPKSAAQIMAAQPQQTAVDAPIGETGPIPTPEVEQSRRQ